MYSVSQLTGKIYLNDIEVVQDDSLQGWQNYVEWLKNGNEPIKFESTEAEQQEIDDKNAFNIETQKYIQRANDGQIAYAAISAEFRLAKIKGIITEEAHAAIEKALILTRNEVLAGQWISALKELELLGSETIGAELYERLHLQISYYITANY